MIHKVCLAEGISEQGLVLYSENGSPMKGATMLATLQRLGVVPSFSRPSVSNDNPYSESLFWTMKHSKYNPVERLWGVLENHWQGEILDSIDKALGLVRSMTYRGIKPTVRKVTKSYRNGVTVAKKAIPDIEFRLECTTGLEHWFIKNSSATPNGTVIFFRGPKLTMPVR
ncbi:MAG: hypothetical protein KZQ60_02510 [Candidatus Thiodiazotropha sp. (ex Lucinoma aequizonata)]|nr:hypothetical protein [Candidatus Thiodiazotropha sp. (ex Lucinoma aequizonata)]MCU7888923.1 hypothetical protein [Candidatus Thiodiazotropha sp. (ex Lucinoma aequizonata)]